MNLPFSGLGPFLGIFSRVKVHSHPPITKLLRIPCRLKDSLFGAM